jgi:hypothetical protein
MPRLSKPSIIVGAGALCAVTVASVTAATLPAAPPAAFTSRATAADLAMTARQQQFGVQSGAQSVAGADSLTTGAAELRSAKAAVASWVHEIQLAQMRATAARLHAAHLAVLAKRAERARQAAAAAAAAAAARKAAAQQAKQQASASTSSSSTSSGSSSSSHPAPSGSPRQIAQQILASEGRSGQFSCLDALWTQESGWNVYAQNPGSGAYGIPQALPGSKMASAGPDWQSNAATQIRWGLSYIDSVYGSPCAAWSHEQSTGWY